MRLAAGRWLLRDTYVSPQDQVVDDADDARHRVGRVVAGRAVGGLAAVIRIRFLVAFFVVGHAARRVGKINGPPIAQQTAREQLVVDVQRGRPEVREVRHGEGMGGG